MLQHYILLGWRSLWRHKFYSAVLIAGLALGMAAAILLAMYGWHELSYDNFHAKKDRIYGVGVDMRQGPESGRSGYTTPPTGPVLLQNLPEVETFTRLCYWFDDVVVMQGDKRYVEHKLLGADSSVFDVFTIPFIAGNPTTALTQPNSLVITESTARKYFGTTQALGKLLHFDLFLADCVVTGVVEDYPDNSHFDFDMLFSLNSLQTIGFNYDNWFNHTFVTYVVLHPQAHAAAVESKMQSLVKTTLSSAIQKRYAKSYDDFYKDGDYYRLFLYPLSKLHLSTLVYENQEGKELQVYMLLCIGVIILILVVVNYTNLATALLLGRATEAGIRRVAGGRPGQLFIQVLANAVWIAVLGMGLAIALVQVALPFFNILTGKTLSIPFHDLRFIGMLVGFTLGIAVASGLYPAITFSSFQTVKALKGSVGLSGHRPWLRNTLVVVQFAACIGMLICTGVVYKQYHYMRLEATGFTTDQVLVIDRASGLGRNTQAFKEALLRHAGIAAVSYAATTPGRHFDGHTQFFADTPSEEGHTIYPLQADQDILKVLDLQVVTGKAFDSLPPTHPQALLNEAAVQQLALSHPLALTVARGTMGTQPVPVIGVVKDFHFKSYHHTIEPLIIYSFNVAADRNYRSRYILVKITGGNLPATLSYIKQQWQVLADDYPFEYSFLDEDFDLLFNREATMAQVCAAFSFIAVGIACLGLLGLVSFLIAARTKEIGIRKIVGASIAQVMLLLSINFMKLLLIAVVIGCLAAWYVMRYWMHTFAYHTSLSWWLFAMAIVAVIPIMLISAGWHVYRAATRNPVEALRYE